ncbi:MAG: type IV pilus biogenesis/stability protein PilW [Woeseiaceae bacterium]|nr:type IV pilus biogenesis/stability protein PilW [Woeseiaceae bacterium]
MKRLSFFLGVIVILSGCVSTTSGPPEPQADKDDAAEFNYQLGARYYRNGNFELARDRLLLSIEFDPRRPVTWTTLGLTYEALENQRLAEDAYDQAVKVDPRSFKALDAYAVYLCRQEKYGSAARYFERAANIVENDNSEITLTNAGVCMAQKPDLVQAEAFFREALEARSNHPEALLQLTLLKFRTADYMSARAFLQRYLNRSVPSPAVLYLGVQIEDKLGDERAKTDFEDRLIREFPTSAEARSVLAAD